MHATAFLKAPEQSETVPIVVVFGTQRYLRQMVLDSIYQRVLGADETDDVGPTRFDGKNTDLKTVGDELFTVSMWGDRRLVVVDDADDFVSKNREGLEKYLKSPAKKSLLVLLVKSWPKTTRLAKQTAKIGLDVQCADLSGAELTRWLCETAQQQHGKRLPRAAAQLMAELAGNELGLLEQELAKLSAYVGDRPQIEADDVGALVGGWKAETTWAMAAAVRSGDLGKALSCLDKLLVAGEAPQKVFGGISFVFRKLAVATELARQGAALGVALKQAGVFPREIDHSAGYLRRIGRPNAEKLLGHLLSADGDLKGASRVSDRIQMELLLTKLSSRG